MRVVIQRVKHAQVNIDAQEYSHIEQGLLVLLGITHDDTASDAEWLVQKILKIRIFDDEAGVMNRSVVDIQGEVMVVSQFTLYADTRRGNRPSFINAGAPDHANALYEYFCKKAEEQGMPLAHGQFGADMQVALINDGPFTIMYDSEA